MKPMQPYHYAWLSKHPERSEEWLRRQLRDGFDVHHLDGDHSNDAPSNLALIEHSDHMGLHGTSARRLLADGQEARRNSNSARARAENGRIAYETKGPGITWASIDARLGLTEKPSEGGTSIAAARAYANLNGLPWPKPSAGPRNGRTGMKKTDAGWVKHYGPHLPQWWGTKP